MPQALPLITKLSQAISKRTKINIKKAQFGDGYAQRAASGLNSQVDSWNIQWIPLVKADADIVISALDAVGSSDYLTWTPYGETSQKRFVVDEESRAVSWNSGYWVISCTITQVF